MTDRFWVVCGDYRRGPFAAQETAERALDGIDALGACGLEHHIESGAFPGSHQ